MHLVNGAQFLNTTFLFLLVGATAVPVLLTVLFPLTMIYASVKSHKLDLSIAVLNLIFLFGEYAPIISSFISIQFLF